MMSKFTRVVYQEDGQDTLITLSSKEVARRIGFGLCKKKKSSMNDAFLSQGDILSRCV